jgi:hypothetical protein
VALIVRIVSADGKKVISRVLPAVPSHIKVPKDARVEIIDKANGTRESLGHYVNRHATKRDRDDDDNGQAQDRVTTETVQTFDEAEAWLAHMDTNLSSDITTRDWFAAGAESQGAEVMGFNQDTLLIGAGVGAAVAAGVVLASDKSSPKDKIAPAAPAGLDLAADDDNGSSTTDNITTKTSELTITGTAEAGSSVEVFDGTTSLGKTTATATGTFTLDVNLAEGVHLVTAKATDQAKNVSANATALRVEVDTTAPNAPAALDLATADDSGTSTSDNITSTRTALTITGTTAASGQIELFDGATSLGKATANATGAFTLDVALAEGTHAITAKAIDAAGNVSAASTTLNIVVDATIPPAPTLLDLAADDDTGASSTDNVTDKTTGLTITGQAEAGVFVDIFAGTTKVGTATVGSNGLFSVDIDRPAGVHSITARAYDAAGNASPSSAPLSLTVTQPGVIVFQSQSASIESAAELHSVLLDGSPLIDDLTTSGAGTIA